MTDTSKPDAPTYSTEDLRTMAADNVCEMRVCHLARQCLRAERERDEAVEVLKPLAALAVHPQSLEPYSIVDIRYGTLTVGDVRAARDFLARHEQAATTKEEKR